MPIPSHRKKYEHFSIEFFYQDEEIRTKDKEGRRLFFDNELKKEITAGKVIKRTERKPIESMEFRKKIEDQNADQICDEMGKQIALSKSCFAQNILDGVDAFDSFDFTEFGRIFSVIERIISVSNGTN